MYHPLNTPTRQTLELLEQDSSVPAPVRAEVADWRQRLEAAESLRTSLRAAGEQARQALDTAKRSAPHRLAGALATGKVTPDLIGTDLPALRQALDTAEDRYAIADHAAHLCTLELGTAIYRRHSTALLGWVAEQRTAVPWWEPVPAHVAHVAGPVSAAFQALLPSDALIQDTEQGTRLLPPVLRLTANLPSGAQSHPLDRWWWGWQCIAAGDYSTDTDPRTGKHLLRLTGAWAQRQPMPDRSSTAPGPAPERRRLMSRSR